MFVFWTVAVAVADADDAAVAVNVDVAVSFTNCSTVFFLVELRPSVTFFRWSQCRFLCL